MQPSPSTRRGRLIVRCLVIVSIVAVSAAIFASPAAADQPPKSEYTYTQSGVLTDVCSFPIGVDSIISIKETDFFDASGALTRMSWHVVEQDTFIANEKTLVGIPFNANMIWLFDSSGNVTHIYADGVAEKVPLPDGSLFISAGRFDFLDHTGEYVLSPDKGNPGNLAAFCAALAP
jgi:hypothetical protein